MKVNGYSKLVSAIVTLGIMTSGLAGCVNKDNSNDSVDTTSITNEMIDTHSFYRTLYENANDDVKRALEDCREVIFEFGKYMDMNKLVDLISSLEIRHENLDISETGYYEKSSNIIVINDNMKNYNDSTLFHEMLHFLSQAGFQKEINVDGKKVFICNALNEGMTQLVVNEFFINDTGVYTKEVAYVRALMEILGKDIMLDSYFSNDIDQLLDRMDNYISRRDAEALVSVDESSDLAWVIIENLYKEVYDSDMDKDPIMMGYKSIVCDKNYMDNKEYDRLVVDKEYFSDDEDAYIIYYFDKPFVENGYYSNNKVENVKIKRPIK